MFGREGRFSVVVVDGLVIVFRTLDRLMYMARGITENMWRHWMPASFAVSFVALLLIAVFSWFCFLLCIVRKI